MKVKVNQIEGFRPTAENRKRIPKIMRHLKLNKKSKVINYALDQLWQDIELEKSITN